MAKNGILYLILSFLCARKVVPARWAVWEREGRQAAAENSHKKVVRNEKVLTRQEPRYLKSLPKKLLCFCG